MKSINEYLKTEFHWLEPREMLKQEVTVLLGVSEEAKEVLADLKISTVFDLASSRIFHNALLVLNSSNTNKTTFSRVGSIPTDVIDNQYRDGDLTQLFKNDIKLLDGIGERNANKVKDVLRVLTIRDLALWPPFHAASHILRKVLIPEGLEDYDPEAPTDLIPSSGSYPTEKAFYSVIVLDEIVRDPDKGLVELNAPIDILALKPDEHSFDRLAYGAIITYEQDWYAQGVALGNLLHSVALAPGESTKIAMINWSRLDSSTLTEEISATEQLSNLTGQQRSISEVTRAVANEAQSGFSQATNRNSANSVGSSRSTSDTDAPGIFASLGSGDSTTTTSSQVQNSAGSISIVNTVAASSGNRDLFASMAQNITNSTQQYASSTRTQRASIIAETIQTESETVKTRVITNYNHMHALTVQYYEVVQIYRTTTSVDRVDRVVFIPMKIIKNWTSDIIERYRRILIRHALNRDFLLALINGPDTVTIRPSVPYNRGGGIDTRDFYRKLSLANEKLGEIVANDPRDPFVFRSRNYDVRGFYVVESTFDMAALKEVIITTTTSTISYSAESVDFLYADARSFGFPNEHEIRLVNLLDICLILDKDTNIRKNVDYLIFDLNIGPVAPNAAIPMVIDIGDNNMGVLSDGRIRLSLLNTTSSYSSYAFFKHLSLNCLYYSQTIWRNMDSSTIALLLSQYKVDEKPLLEKIDGAPLGVYGNYLLFRMNVDTNDEQENIQWERWKNDHGFSDGNIREEEIIPLPSGGVFAEAVLGRFNSAEKLDMTRFWNWQDSPIPFTAPEIAAINSGSRFQNVQAETGQLPQPILNIVNSQPLPSPTGINSVLAALSSANIFRDMSGLTEALNLAQNGLRATYDAAIAAGDQAQANAATTALANLEALKSQTTAGLGALQALVGAATTAVGAAVGVPVPAPGLSNISNAGSAINQAQKIDAKKAASAVSSDGTGVGSQNGSGSRTASGGTTSSTGSGSQRGNSTSRYNDGRSTEERTLDLITNPYAGAEAILASASAGSVERSGQNILNEVRDWLDLINFVPPQTIVNELDERNMQFQRIDHANNLSDLNLDFYSIRVKKRPTKGGAEISAAELFDLVRRNLTENKLTPTVLTSWKGYGNVDQAKWETDDPVGAVLSIDLGGPDNAAVVVSDFQARFWRFSTVSTEDTGNHPVSGNREFGYMEGVGDIIFYTRGADRPTGLVDWDPLVLYLGHLNWVGFQRLMLEFINENGGEAEVGARHQRHYDWNSVVKFTRYQVV